jgi:hypothetical protein
MDMFLEASWKRVLSNQCSLLASHITVSILECLGMVMDICYCYQ